MGAESFLNEALWEPRQKLVKSNPLALKLSALHAIVIPFFSLEYHDEYQFQIVFLSFYFIYSIVLCTKDYLKLVTGRPGSDNGSESNSRLLLLHSVDF